MTTAAAFSRPRANRIPGMVMALAAVLAALLCLAPQADAAKKKRIVAISPFAAQTMVQLGVKPLRVGETLGATNRQKKLLRGIGILKLSHPNGPNLEQMARLRPDVVFSSSRWAAGHAALKRLGIRVVVADPTAPGAVYQNVKKIGRVIGRKAQANRLNKRIRKQLRNATRRIVKREKVLVVLGIGTTSMAFLGNSWGGKLVQKAGGRLVTGGASARGGFARISDEVILAENPDRIIVVPHGNARDLGRITEHINNNVAFQTTKAGQTGNIKVSVDNTLLQAGTDLGPTVRWVRTQLKNW